MVPPAPSGDTSKDEKATCAVVSKLLSSWLKLQVRGAGLHKRFMVTDVSECAPISGAVKNDLVRRIIEARHDLQLLEKVADALGWASVRSIITGSQPTLLRVKRGDFGEVLTAALLTEFLDYTIPISKMHFALTGNQTLPSTDLLAFRIDGDAIAEICFVESKLRTKTDTSAAVLGLSQLKADYSKNIPDMIVFVLARLHEANSPLFDKFLAYLRGRERYSQKEKFRLGLIWEDGAWSETVLSNLEAASEEKRFPDLHVHVVRLGNLGPLTDELFARVGAGEILDDD